MIRNNCHTSAFGKVEVVYKDGYKEVSKFTCNKYSGIVLNDFLRSGSKWIFHVLQGSCLIDNNTILKENDFFVHDEKKGCLSIYMLEKTVFMVFSRNLNFFNSLKKRDDKLFKLLNLIKSKDKTTYDHSNRVTNLTRKVATALNYTGYNLFNIIIAANFHDIGKIEVPNRILLKPSSLSEEEIETVKEHVDYGKNLLKALNNNVIEKLVFQHHERIDGSGYPLGLVGNEIDESAQIIGICDTFDAMTTLKAYNREKILTEKEACNYLIKQSNYLFPEKLVKIFLSVYNIPYHQIILKRLA